MKLYGNLTMCPLPSSHCVLVKILSFGNCETKEFLRTFTFSYFWGFSNSAPTPQGMKGLLPPKAPCTARIFLLCAKTPLSVKLKAFFQENK